MIGRTLGHYRILDRLATGGMGVVWLAEDETLKRKVALKTLREDITASPERLARFEREAKAIAALNHPNIVTLHSIEEVDGVRFLIMEYVEGQPLDELIPAGGLALPEFLRIAIPIADALAAAHVRGITHRDLKPANVMVGEGGRVKILDFGLAKLKVPDSTAIYGKELQSTLTREGTVVGTLHYMSPEQLQLKPVDHRTDLFSLGIVLYEMATGDLPFGGESAAQVISSVLRDHPRRLDETDRRLPAEIADLVHGCLEKDVEKRTASAAEVRDRLERIARDVETGAVPTVPSRLGRLARRARRGASAAALAGAAALIVAIAAVPWALGYWRDRGGAADPPPGPQAPPGIAVLPLANFSGDPDYFVDGMTDGLIGSLARLGGVRVISRQSAMHYKGSTQRLPQIARELDVGYLVEGSISREGDRLRLQARLVRPDPEQQVWAAVFDRPARGVLALQNEVASAILHAVSDEVSPEDEARLAAAAPVEPEVYEAHLQGRFFLDQGRPETLEKALTHFERALEIEPGFAPAHVGRAEVFVWQAYVFVDHLALAARAEAEARRALEIDPTLSGAHAVLGDILRYFRWDWDAAEAAYLRALDLAPGDPRVRRKYWGLLASLGRFDEAREQLELASRLDPLSAAIHVDFGYLELFEGDPEAAAPRFRRSLEMDPEFPYAHGGVWLLCHRAGRAEACWPDFEAFLGGLGLNDLRAAEPDPVDAVSYRARLLEVAQALDERSRRGRIPVSTGAAIYAAAGDFDRAEAWILRAYDEHSPDLVWLAQDPSWAALRDRPAIARLVRELDLEPRRAD